MTRKIIWGIDLAAIAAVGCAIVTQDYQYSLDSAMLFLYSSSTYVRWKKQQGKTEKYSGEAREE